MEIIQNEECTTTGAINTNTTPVQTTIIQQSTQKPAQVTQPVQTQNVPQVQPNTQPQTLPTNIFEKKPQEVAKVEEKPKDENKELVNKVFDQAILNKIQTDDAIKDKVLDTASTYVETQMTIKKTEVDTEYKAAVFDNNKDACESYGFNEKTTPTWAIRLMRAGYNVMLAIWWFIGSFTFMPIIFVSKKLSVGIKKAWLAIVLAIFIYLAVILTPIIISACTSAH